MLSCRYTFKQNILQLRIKTSSGKKIRVWDITKTKIVLGEEICRLLPALHAMTGCDTTSRLFGIGKGAALKKVDIFKQFQETCQYFLDYL